MLKNYFILSLRKFARQKFYSLINLLGLTVGLASVILIMLYVTDELSYDRYHTNVQRIYRVVENQYYPGQPVFPVAVTPGPLGPSLEQEFTAVEHATRVIIRTIPFKFKEKQTSERGVYVDPSYLKIFSLQFTFGAPGNALGDHNSIILTEKLAVKYFGEDDPVGKIIKVSDRELTITGVIKNFPRNSHIQPDFLISMELMIANNPGLSTSWGNNTLYTYILVKEGVGLEDLNQRIKGQIKKNLQQSVSDIYLQPLTDIHLGSVHFTADVDGKGNKQYVSIFLIVAIFILIIACINFMNLATARSMRRSKEVGLRKSIGAVKGQLIFQFLSESIFTAITSMALSILVVDLLLPQFNFITGKQLHLDLLTNYANVIYLLGFALGTGLIAGSYPAFFLSSFQPTHVLKFNGGSNLKGVAFRKALVVAQFSISIVMISGVLIVSRQIEFIRSKNLGYEKENVIKIPRISKNYSTFKNELLVSPGIINVSASDQHPLYVENSSTGLNWEGKSADETVLIHNMGVDFDYLETMGMKIKNGRSFKNGMGNDSSALIFNEEALRVMNLQDPIGETVNDGTRKFTIIGVVEDFHFKSIHQKIEPLVLYLGRGIDQLNYTVIRIADGDPKSQISTIQEVWNKFNPGSEFAYTFLDDDFGDLYQAEERTGIIFKYFSILAILISCLGLFGLATFTLEQRTKEFGVRKVFGASFFQLFANASIGFIALVLIAFCISIPVALYLVNQWLNGFAYHITPGYDFLVWSGTVSVGIALITISYQSVKSALRNPVNSLRCE